MKKPSKSTLILSGIILIFLLIKISQIGFKLSDENIYFHMGDLILQGQVPYKDFFFASPPIQILIIAGFLLFTGGNVILLKLIPLIAASITSIFVFILARRVTSKEYSLLSSILYLFSTVILTTTDHSTGIHLTTMFFIISIYLITKKSFFSAGLLASLALLTRLYSAFAIFGVLLYLLIENRKNFLKFVLGLITLFLTANLILLAAFGEHYLQPVFLYHLLKSAGIEKGGIFAFFIKGDFLLIILSLSALFIKKTNHIRLFLAATISTLFFYVFYTDIYYLYLGLIMPFLAILSGYTLHKLSDTFPQKAFVIMLTIILAFIVIYNTSIYLGDHADTSKIDFVEDISEYVSENSLPNEKIYGSFDIAPLVATLSEREIVNNYVDTNEKTFITGIYDVEERTDKLRGNVRFVIMSAIVSPEGTVLSIDKIIKRDFLFGECTTTKIYYLKDYSNNAVILFDCNPKISVQNVE